ncbi:MAG: hypothetical protein Q8850_02875, partial [Candidatus Phytoplasma australasiaticum]|nr:hypothetical protein [Candidatus Phytoplasma australasiaticum]
EVSTPTGEFIMARRVYSDCVVTICKYTLANKGEMIPPWGEPPLLTTIGSYNLVIFSLSII